MRRGVSAAAAASACLGLGLQFAVTVGEVLAEGGTMGGAAWRYFGFYTILANLGTALVASAMALRPESELAGPRMRFMAAANIVVVAIVYSVALRAISDSAGWEKAADHALHDITPALFLVAWITSGHGRLDWRDALWPVLPALAYCVYALARGAVDGWYAYWFLDPHQSGPIELARNIVVLGAAFLTISLALAALDRWLARRQVAAAT